jgi:hypothetical protein
MDTQAYTPAQLKRWTQPDNYSGTQFDEYYRTGIGQSRDSDCLERANFAAMLEALGGESETVVVGHFGHWAVGWVEAIYIHESDTVKLKIADKIAADLLDYPVIDDMALSETEQAERESVMDTYSSDWINEVCSMLGIESEVLTVVEKEELSGFVSDVYYQDTGYRGMDDAFVTEESILRYLNSYEAKHDERNITKLLQACFDIQAGA